MNKIDFPRTDIFNKNVFQQDLESWYVNDNNLAIDIQSRLRTLLCQTRIQDEVRILTAIIKNVNFLLLAKPYDLMKITRLVKQIKYKINHGKIIVGKDFNNKITKAFNYKGYRERKNGILVELAEKINVKSCPYCNMSYTLIAKKANGKKIAKFQFDHFYNKSDYPMLSMSLYNLIPSCSVCNQGKSIGDLDIRFNPYYSSINDTFVFKVRNPIPLYTGKKKGDFIDIDAIATSTSQKDIKDFDKYKETFHIETLYQRHGDVAKEIFDKAYLYPYINEDDNFKMLPNYSKEYRKQLWLGTYTKKEDIEKRPLTKLKQDLWEQATQIWHSKEDF